MSADRARTMGLTGREIAEALASTLSDEAEPTTSWSWSEPESRPAAWRAFGEDE